ncbi:hypothetical protein ACLB2K_053596 [Fragaria x ananassa]
MAHSLRSSLLLPRPCFHNSLFLFFYSSKTLESNPTADYLINHHQFSQEAALKASATIAYLKNPADSDSVLSFLKQSGFSKTHLEGVVQKTPRILCANLDTSIKPKIKIFQDLGFSDSDIADIISCDPWILWRSADNKLGPALVVLKRILGSNAEVCKFLKLSRRYLQHDLDKSLKANMELLEGFGISSSQLVKCMFRFPRLFLHKQKAILEFVERVDKMEFDRSSRLFISAIGIMSSLKVETLELKKKLFRSLGFSEKDVFTMFKRSPMVFGISEKKLKEVTELLVSVGQFDVPYLLSNPELLMYSVERRLKPRLKVLEILEKKNLLEEKPKLNTVCKYSEQKFAEKFILPYANELGKDMTYK